jgi:tetratricopeptide (TPR) repeat protein
MRPTFRTAAFLAVLALVAVPAEAGTFKLRNGTSVTGKAQRYDEASKTLYVRTDSGQDVQYRLDQLDARSTYLVNASLVPADSASAQLAVANFARDAGLYAHAARRYGIAEKLDPKLKGAVAAEMTKLKRVAAAACMENARAAIKKNDVSEAERWLKALVEKLPDEPEAREAASLLEQRYTDARAAKMAAADQKASDALKKDVEKGKKRFAEMVEKNKKGLQARGGSQADGLFQSALVDGRAVLEDIDEIEKKYDDPRVKENVGSYRKVVVDEMVDVHLSKASLLTVRSDYQGALREVNQALALDPKNERALSARARIEEASSQGWGRPWI